MKRFVVHISLLLFAGLLICELSSIIYKIWPETEYIQYDLFLSKSYHLKMSVLWYIYEIANIINRILWCFAFCVVALKFSIKLYWIGVTFLLYEFSQFFFYIWNRNTSFASNIFVYLTMLVVAVEILVPSKNVVKIKRLEK